MCQLPIMLGRIVTIWGKIVIRTRATTSRRKKGMAVYDLEEFVKQ